MLNEGGRDRAKPPFPCRIGQDVVLDEPPPIVDRAMSATAGNPLLLCLALRRVVEPKPPGVQIAGSLAADSKPSGTKSDVGGLNNVMGSDLLECSL